MTEKEALDSIPDDWIRDVNSVEVEQRAREMWSSVVFGLAEEQGIRLSATDTIDSVVTKLAKGHRISKSKEWKSLKETCLQNSRIDIFTTKYGHLFEKDENGELSYSIAMLRKITGLQL